LVDRVGDAFLYENTAALPRALLVGRAEPEADVMPEDPEARVQIAGLPAPIGEPGPVGQVHILARHRDEMRLVATAERPAYLVINELYDPAWTAITATGERLEILRANRLFRAVALPAGTTELLLRYEPLSPGSLARLAGRINTYR
jgi:hypothetical protein